MLPRHGYLGSASRLPRRPDPWASRDAHWSDHWRWPSAVLFFVVAAAALALGTVSRQLEARAQAVANAAEPAAFTPGEFITPQLTAGYLKP